MTSPSDPADLVRAIQAGLTTRMFSPASKIILCEATEDEATSIELDDVTLDEKLKSLDTESKGSTTIKFRTFFISWNSTTNATDRVLTITAKALLQLCQAVRVSVPFVQGLLEPSYWVRPGNGLFLHQDATGQLLRLDLFYRYSFGLGSERSYTFTTYDFNKKLTTSVCVNFVHKAMPFVEKLALEVARSGVEQPLALHLLMANHAIDYWNESASFPRRALLNDARRIPRSQLKIFIDVDGFEDQLLFLAEASETFRKLRNMQTAPAGLSSEATQIAYHISRIKQTKRWITNYKDRTNIRINLAFHLSTQVDNELNLQISKSTTTLARDAQRDSASMITIAAVTMFFLPGTFISAVFSMTFFNFQQDPETGRQQFQVSERWWYFLAATIPLTVLVFAVWITWQRYRYRRFALEDVLAQQNLSGTDWRKEKVDSDQIEYPIAIEMTCM